LDEDEEVVGDENLEVEEEADDPAVEEEADETQEAEQGDCYITSLLSARASIK